MVFAALGREQHATGNDRLNGRTPRAAKRVCDRGFQIGFIDERGLPVSSRRTIAAPSASAFSLAKARARGRYFMPQSGAGISRSAAICRRPARMRPATSSAVSASAGRQVDHAEQDRLARQVRQHAEIEFRLRRLDRDLLRDAFRRAAART